VVLPPGTPDGPVSATRDPPPSRKIPAQSLGASNRFPPTFFHRNTRAIALTPKGELFLESCRRIFAELNKIELEFSQSKAKPKGRFKVSLLDIGTLMMPTLHGFMREYPEVQLDLEFTDNLVDVIDGGYNVVIRCGEEQADSRLISRRLGSYRLGIVGSPSYFEKHGTPTTPDDLLSHPCLHRRYPGLSQDPDPTPISGFRSRPPSLR
jgi:DNA-binding transcriptional LysR family regulator